MGIPSRLINVGCMMDYMRYTPRTFKELLDANPIIFYGIIIVARLNHVRGQGHIHLCKCYRMSKCAWYILELCKAHNM